MSNIELIEEVKVHGGTQKRFKHESSTLKCPMFLLCIYLSVRMRARI